MSDHFATLCNKRLTLPWNKRLTLLCNKRLTLLCYYSYGISILLPESILWWSIIHKHALDCQFRLKSNCQTFCNRTKNGNTNFSSWNFSKINLKCEFFFHWTNAFYLYFKYEFPIMSISIYACEFTDWHSFLLGKNYVTHQNHPNSLFLK